jgi:hypothetical protein
MELVKSDEQNNPETNVLIVLHPIPATEEEFLDRFVIFHLQSFTNNPFNYGFSVVENVHRLRESSDVGTSNRTNQPNCSIVLSVAVDDICDMVVGPSHVAFLLKDGTVCRLRYSINTDALDLNKNDPMKTLVYIYINLIRP